MYKNARAYRAPEFQSTPLVHESTYDLPSERMLGMYARFQEPLRVRKPRGQASAPRKFSWEA